MNCKNCERPLRTDYSFCSNCGAKIIRNRLTFKNLWFDIIERYFNVDNTFLRTFLHLFTKPQEVIIGYISGVRKKYLNPISYLGIALTLSGILLFVLRKANIDIDYDLFNTGMDSKAMKPIQDFTFDYNSLLFISYIPMMAMASWLAFKDKGLKFTERIVAFIYSMSQYSIAIFLPTLLLLLLAPQNYMTLSSIAFLFIFVYNAWIIRKISGLKGIAFMAHIFLFIVLFMIQFLLIYGLVLPIIMFVSGVLDIQDFAPRR